MVRPLDHALVPASPANSASREASASSEPITSSGSEFVYVAAAESIKSSAAIPGYDATRKRVITSADERLHTVSFLAAADYAHENGLLTGNGIALLVCTGSGITAGAALYRT
jgi:hypothetical protein